MRKMGQKPMLDVRRFTSAREDWISQRRTHGVVKDPGLRAYVQRIIMFFSSKPSIRNWISKNGFIVDNRLRRPIIKSGNTFRVRQKNPDFFNKKTFKVESLGKGVKGVYGMLKR